MKITCSRRSVMRCITKRIALLSAALMIVAVPALADESSMEGKYEQGQQRIDRIKGEIGRGTAVYTNDELNRLNRKLDEAVKTLEFENLSGGG
jgi:hypothetical protein